MPDLRIQQVTSAHTEDKMACMVKKNVTPSLFPEPQTQDYKRAVNLLGGSWEISFNSAQDGAKARVMMWKTISNRQSIRQDQIDRELGVLSMRSELAKRDLYRPAQGKLRVDSQHEEHILFTEDPAVIKLLLAYFTPQTRRGTFRVYFSADDALFETSIADLRNTLFQRNSYVKPALEECLAACGITLESLDCFRPHDGQASTQQQEGKDLMRLRDIRMCLGVKQSVKIS